MASEDKPAKGAKTETAPKTGYLQTKADVIFALLFCVMMYFVVSIVYGM